MQLKVKSINTSQQPVTLNEPTSKRPDPEVPEKKPRRKFTAKYKLRILEEIDEGKEIVEVPSYARKKPGRKPLPEILPRVDVVHDIADDEKICGCGANLDRIGEDVSEKLDIIPAIIRGIRLVRPKYACKACEGLETEGPVVKIAPVSKQIISKGIATAGLLAHVLTAKFCDALPFYRQERMFERLEVDVPRSTMCNWAMKAAAACLPILNLLKQEIRSGPLINIYETSVQVLKEPGRSVTTKSYMWICRGGSQFIL